MTMYGRSAQQRMVNALLRRAEQGAGGVLLVDGEPGIGRSLLLQECVHAAGARGFSLAAGAGDRLGRTIPYYTLLTALRQPLTGDGSQPDDPGDPDDPGETVPAQIGELHEQLIARAAAAPVLVCLDDLQWASQASLLALRVLPGQLARHPVAWALARSGTRPGSTADLLFSGLERDGATRLTLTPLSGGAVTEMLTGAFGAPPDDRLQAMAAGAAGNPAVLAELIGGLRDDQAVRVTAGQARLISASLPARVNRIAQQRLDGLSAKTQHLLKTAATLGGSFRLADVAEMLGETPAGLLPLVEEMLASGIVAADDTAFSFRQRLLGRAVGEMIPRPARSALHRQFGEILLRRGESAAAAAGHLLEAAGTGDHASLAGLDGAAAELLPSAPRMAAGLAQRALELTQPDDPAVLSRSVAAAEALTAAGRLEPAARIVRQGLAQPLPAAAEARFRCALSAILCASGQPEQARAQAEAVLAQPGLPAAVRDAAVTARLQALAGWPADGDAQRLAADVLQVPSQHSSQAVAAALVARALADWDNGQVSPALEQLHEAARRGRAVAADARDAQPLLALAAALADLGRYGEAEKVMQTIDGETLRGIPAQAVLSILAARLSLARGDLAQAATAARAAVADAGAAHGYASLGHSVLALIALRQGDLAAAAQYLADRGAVVPHAAACYARSAVRMTHAELAAAADGPAAAISHLRAAWADPRHRPGILLGQPGIPAWLVRTAQAAGQPDLAAEVAQAAGALAHGNPEIPAVIVAAAHSLGLLNQDPALLADAAAQHTDPWARASAAEDLGVLLASQASKEQAIARLTEAMAGYGQSGATADMARIRRRLRGLGIRRRHWTLSAAGRSPGGKASPGRNAPRPSWPRRG